ncbi:MAG: N,N-dimethylformamidase beta subunit family domain-containing protein, partial [Polyangiales bacterium]
MSFALRPRLASLLAFSTVTLAASASYAGIIADENAKAGITGSWTARDDGTARFDGVVDLYPAQWSIARGESIKLKVRSTTTYDVRVMRLGWYGGAGATEVKVVTGQPASPQAYPTADAKYGLAEAKWTDSVTIATDSTWTPGLYVARAETSDGKDAVTFFVIRDDGLTAKLPILLVVGIATHQAYNAWPGDAKGGKSLYGFNSSPAHPTDSIGTLNQAVRVSYDRPFLVGGGTGDVGGYEYPYIRFLEKNGWDVAYATDVDLHEHPEIATGRRVITFSGHQEYTTGKIFDTALAARDAGTNFLFLSGDTWSWQVRLEAGGGGALSTEIGYKESFVKDPEQKAAFAARTAGDIPTAIEHFKLVTRGWKNLEQDDTTTPKIDLRRPGMLLTGVQSAGVIRQTDGTPSHGGLYPWADLVVVYPSF